MTPDEQKALSELVERWLAEGRDCCDHLEGGIYAVCAGELEQLLEKLGDPERQAEAWYEAEARKWSKP